MRPGIALLLLGALAGCAGGGHPNTRSSTVGDYAPPGPPGDPWGPYITEAAARFSVPERWIREVMRQESGGHAYLNGQPTTSATGAAGLMQVMPGTYADLRDRYGLGSDPYNPRDNIMAGAAYIREMYDRFGSPAFLAAYNAGPGRVDDYLAGRSGLPRETVNYLASVAPRLGGDRPMSGPLVAYADRGNAAFAPSRMPRRYASLATSLCWRDPDAAYDPDAPCRPPPSPAPVPVLPAATAACVRDPNAAYDPGAPCQAALPAPLPVQVAEAPAPQPLASGGRHCWHDPNAAYDPDAACLAPPQQLADATPATTPGQTLWSTQATSPPPAAAPAHPAPVPPHHDLARFLIPSAAAAEVPASRARLTGSWSIQVGAFANAEQARLVAEQARGFAPHVLAGAHTVLGQTTPFGGHVLYRARLAGMSAKNAALACSSLSAQRQACVTVPPGG